MPTLFESTNPIFKMFTQFQLEVNNQFSEVFKDLPRSMRKKGLAALTGVLLQYFLGAFLYNEVYEFFAGRRPALDPFGILNDTVGDLTGYELPNLVGLATGTETSFETEKVGIGEAGKNLAGSVLDELPFSSGLTLLGIETDGGRIPASSAVPDPTALWDAATTEGWSKEKRWKEVSDELSKLAYVLPPFGGNQMQKIWKGASAYIRGGSYNVDAEGNDILQYPVYNDEPGDFWGLVRSMIMGKSSLPTAQDWVESGFKSLSAKQTAVYQDLTAAGIKEREAFALIQELQGAEKTDEQSKLAVQRGILEKSDVADKGKTIAYYGLIASDSERELMDQLADAGVDQAEMYNLINGLNKAKGLKGDEKKEARRDLLANAPLTEEEKKIVVASFAEKDEDGNIKMVTEKGNPSQYNLLNGTYTSENKEMIDGILREEWGYDGLVVSDWDNMAEQYREHLAGNDVRMPYGSPKRLKRAMEEGLPPSISRYSAKVSFLISKHSLAVLPPKPSMVFKGTPTYIFFATRKEKPSQEELSSHCRISSFSTPLCSRK